MWFPDFQDHYIVEHDTVLNYMNCFLKALVKCYTSIS